MIWKRKRRVANKRLKQCVEKKKNEKLRARFLPAAGRGPRQSFLELRFALSHLLLQVGLGALEEGEHSSARSVIHALLLVS